MKSIEERLVSVEVEEPVTIPNSDGTTRTVMVRVPALRDPEDGEIYLGTDAVALLDKAKARHMGVLAPQELAELRKRLDLTQSEIAELLQIGEKSWSRWETGREIPSRSMNLLVLALYEGKISLPWLRSRRLTEGEPAKPPVLRARGWETLWHEQIALSNVVTWQISREHAWAAAASLTWVWARHFEMHDQLPSAVDAPVQRHRTSQITGPRVEDIRINMETMALSA